jgi:uncharacterized membrane protein
MALPTDLYGSFLWNVGYAICHQLPDRSFLLGGLQMPMCARDTGTYLGFLVTFGLFLFRKRFERSLLPDRAVLAASFVGVFFYMFDSLSSYLGFRSTSNELRLFAGLAFGSGTAFLLLSVAGIVLFKASERSRTFTYRDLIIIYPLLALISIPFFLDLGITAYFLEATLIIIGLVTMFYIIVMVFVGAATSWNLADKTVTSRLIVASLLLESSIFIVLWVAKFYLWRYVQIPGS